MANPSVSERPSKLLAEWFWTDRWIGSSAFILPIEPRGLYREMLTQAWRRGGSLPNDHEAIRRAVGCTMAEWKRCWPKVEKYWRVDGDSLINDTQAQVYAETLAMQERYSSRGKKGAQARWEHSTSNAQASTQAPPEQCTPSPSPSPSPIPTTPRAALSVARATLPAKRHGLQTLHRSGHQTHAFCSERMCVPDFQHAKFVGAIGGQDAASRLLDFYADTVAGLPDSVSIDPDPLKFWPPRVTSRWPPEDASVGTRTAALQRATAEFLRGGVK